MIGMNSRLDNLQAAILRVKLRHLDKWLTARRNNAAYYNERLKHLPLTVPHTPDYNEHTYHLYVLRAHSDLQKLLKFMQDADIEARTYYPVALHLQECYGDLGYKKGDFKEAEKASEETFSIAVYPELKKTEMDYVIKTLERFFKA